METEVDRMESIGEEEASQTQKPTGVMKRARWGATHRIHEHFVDGFPELEERFVREREAAERRFEYNLGSRNFATKREGEEGIDTLKVLFRKLDRAIGLRDATMVQTIREEFLAELRHWNWRKGARVEFKRRKQVHSTTQIRPDNRTKPRLQASRDRSQEQHKKVDGAGNSSEKNNTGNILKDDGLIPTGPPRNQSNITTCDDATAAMTLATACSGGGITSNDSQGKDLFNSLTGSKNKTSSSGLDDSSVDDLDADDVDAVDERVSQRRVKPRLEEDSAGDACPQDKLAANDARRHLLAESVAVALVTLKWRCLQPESGSTENDAKVDKEQKDQQPQQNAHASAKYVQPEQSISKTKQDTAHTTNLLPKATVPPVPETSPAVDAVVAPVNSRTFANEMDLSPDEVEPNSSSALSDASEIH